MSAQDPSQALALPPGFKTIMEIRDLPHDQLVRKVLVSLVGIVKDFQPPMQTSGTDFKCTIELIDHSIQHENYGIKFVIFWPEQAMPRISGPGDVVLLRNVKAQMYSGTVSFITTFPTECHVLSASEFSEPSFAASKARWRSFPPKFKVPSLVETEYAVWAKGHASEFDLPSDHEFHERSFQAMKINDKFSLLRDVKPEKFYNILGQVIRVHDRMDVLSVYLSDYTANSEFYNNAWCPGGPPSEGQDGDVYGYTKPMTKDSKDWPGPFGKMSIQLNLYDEHAEFVREHVKIDQWVLLSNVHVKYGKMGGLLEGYLRGDRQRFDGKIQVQIMKRSEIPNGDDPRWIDGLRRKREYEKKHEAQKKALLCEDDGLGNKRKAEDNGEPKLNSKQRRIKKRAEADQKGVALEAKEAERSDLNGNIKCCFQERAPVSLIEILEPEHALQTSGPGYLSPFTLRKYRANVRIVNYAPERIEDFSVWRRESEYDMLSEYSGGENTDLEEDMRSYKSGKGFAKKIWEWRFWLQVEDAGSSSRSKIPKERMWLLVDNASAQGLLGLDDDAANLRKNSELLASLKEQLFKLWGDLEEQKSAKLSKQSNKSDEPPPPSFESTTGTRPTFGEQPDLDSDSEGEGSVVKISKGISTKSYADRSQGVILPIISAGDDDDGSLKPRNKAFTCCIQQYGVKVHEDDPSKADAGERRRWQRIFGLFGTSIA
ncbi:uncharacterized protein RCO7_10094 [Rhynchosporium graminicola]|uniref:Protection of telomeres protein 1 n=1 Tax=Rhynchosporium graminicola TaxID=2792576 RepID=A0A1E1K8T2_9HELO|nr:uncharacterized protein RCO7_10094 [Rhynchosporium commune]